MPAAIQHAGEIDAAGSQLVTHRPVQVQIVHQAEMSGRLVGKVDKILPGVNLIGLFRRAEPFHPLAQSLGTQDGLRGIQSIPDHDL